MKNLSRRAAAVALSAALLCASALALTPDELGTILKNEYNGEVPAQVWEQTTVEGMLSALGDPFSHYYDPQGYLRFQDTVNGADDQGPTVQVTTQGDRGTLAIRTFGADTYEGIKTGVEQNGEVDHWMVDLRGNRGGSLSAAVDALSAFAGGGELIYLRDRDDKLYAAKSDHKKLTIRPVVVLMDSATASAGELYAAGIRDRQMGILVGSRTYGKGVAQTAFDAAHPEYGAFFADGSALLLTTERAFSEGMTSNNIMGVLPHLAVDDDVAQGVAQLLCADAPTSST